MTDKNRTDPNHTDGTQAGSLPNAILLVEDNAAIRNLLSAILMKEGFEVETAENGQEALDKLSSFTPRLIVCDLLMPVMDGRELLQTLNGHTDYQDIAFVFLSANTSAELTRELTALGAKALLEKGSGHMSLISSIREILANV